MRVDELVHAAQVVEVGVEVIEKDRVEKDAADLRQRRMADRFETAVRFLADAQLGARQRIRRALAADADGEQPRCAETDRRTERCDQAQTAVAEVALADLGPNEHRRQDDRNRSRSENVVERELDAQRDAPALHPQRMAGAALMNVYDLPEW